MGLRRARRRLRSPHSRHGLHGQRDRQLGLRGHRRTGPLRADDRQHLAIHLPHRRSGLLSRLSRRGRHPAGFPNPPPRPAALLRLRHRLRAGRSRDLLYRDVGSPRRRQEREIRHLRRRRNIEHEAHHRLLHGSVGLRGRDPRRPGVLREIVAGQPPSPPVAGPRSRRAGVAAPVDVVDRLCRHDGRRARSLRYERMGAHPRTGHRDATSS